MELVMQPPIINDTHNRNQIERHKVKHIMKELDEAAKAAERSARIMDFNPTQESEAVEWNRDWENRITTLSAARKFLENLRMPTFNERSNGEMSLRVRVKHGVSADKLVKDMLAFFQRPNHEPVFLKVRVASIQAVEIVTVGWLAGINAKHVRRENYEKALVSALLKMDCDCNVKVTADACRINRHEDPEGRPIRALHVLSAKEDMEEVELALKRLYNPVNTFRPRFFI